MKSILFHILFTHFFANLTIYNMNFESSHFFNFVKRLGQWRIYEKNGRKFQCINPPLLLGNIKILS